MDLARLWFTCIGIPLLAACALPQAATSPMGPPVPPPPPSVEAFPPGRVAGEWNLGADLIRLPFLTNPHGDRLGVPVWSFLTAPAFDSAPADFRLLPRFNLAAFGLPGVNGFQESIPGGLATTFPLVAVNRSGRAWSMGRPGGREWRWPAGGVVLHPNSSPVEGIGGVERNGIGVAAAVGWRSTIAGKVSVHLAAELVDPGPNQWQGSSNDGVELSVRLGSRVLLRERVLPGGRPWLVWDRQAIPVAEGETLMVVVGPGRTPAGDTLLLRLEIRRDTEDAPSPDPLGKGSLQPA